MNVNYKPINEDEKTVSLTGLCLYVLKKWKIMLVFAVIMAVLAGGLFTVKDYKAYQASQNAEPGVGTEKVNVSESVKASVLSKIETIASYRKTIEDYEYYYKNSIKVKLDPNNVHQGIIEYLFASSNNEEMLKAISVCEEMLFSDEKYEELLLELSEPTELAMLKEVISFGREYPVVASTGTTEEYDNGSLTFRILIRHYNEEECEKIYLFALEQMESLQAMLDEMGIIVEVSPTAAKLEQRVDRSIPALGKELRSSINTIYENIATIETKMTDDEAKYYEYLLNENSKVEENTSVTNEDASILEFLNMKMGILGAIAGVACVAGYFVLIYLVGGFVHNKEELSSWLNVPVAEFGAETDMLAALVHGVAMKHHAKKIYLTGTVSQINSERMEQLSSLVEPKGIEIIVGNNILKDGKALQEATDCGSMILLEKSNVSKEKDVKEAIEKAVSCGIHVLSVVLEK